MKQARTKKSRSQSNEFILQQYAIAVTSRQASLLGRREVLSGKAKFGIFGDGKELPQLAMAQAFQPGDWRSGYYRDQTFMFAIGESNVRAFFAQMYANTNVEQEPASAGRSMNGHFATRFLDDDGNFLPQTKRYNVSADVSPTASQMPRLVGLAYASRLYRDEHVLQSMVDYSVQGNEVAFGTIGNASCAEGMFWESINAIGVLKAPAVISIWDDGYGISVPNHLQVTKSNVGELLRGFQRHEGTTDGYDIHVVHAWDYQALCAVYQQAATTARKEHVPQIVHVIDVTQPQGHSTSGSHERYKDAERLAWEQQMDGISIMRRWIVDQRIATEEELVKLEAECVSQVQSDKQEAWHAYQQPIIQERAEVVPLLTQVVATLPESDQPPLLQKIQQLEAVKEPFRKDSMVVAHAVLAAAAFTPSIERTTLARWRQQYDWHVAQQYSSHLHSESTNAVRYIKPVRPEYDESSQWVNGSEVVRAAFDVLLQNPAVVMFGEDTGKIGDVNQGTRGLQEVYGELRVSDTGIRECTIVGQAIGMAMRGLRPIAEIQYLDYLLYALQLLSDDLATVQWRTRGGQKAPAVIRTRGHRLEGVWHSGSPMAGIINLVRGMVVCVPRNCTQAAGMYATLLQSDEPGIVVEVLNGYRLKEQMPTNIGSYTIELGVPEVLRQGSHCTMITYGASVRAAQDACVTLEQLGVSVELIDVQTLLPFDIYGIIGTSLQKTNRLVVLDEDVPGGASAFMLQQVLETQNGYRFLDSAPCTITAKEHRPAYGTDGNYWTKPEAEHIVNRVYTMMHEVSPVTYPLFYE
jgi:2-oxoisovalerate dehydrogenase E1 component